MARRKIGIWLIGAKGGVATTVTVGLVALKKGMCGPVGLVTHLPLFEGLDLPEYGDMVIGGHDIRTTTLYAEAQQLASNNHALDGSLVDRIKGELDKIDKNHRSGTLVNVGSTIEKFASDDLKKKGETPRAAIERIQADLKGFASDHKLDQVIVVNVASTEPPIEDDGLPTKWKDLEKLLDKPKKCPLAASSIYAIAALDLGYPYINFTPSLGSAPAAIQELAIERGTCHIGHDGKTGETLLKSALAPMFAARNLQVMSWVGHNIFGNMDGKVLDDPSNKKTKVRSKDRLLHQILGYSPQTLVSIEYIESLGDWKTAWDHIHFKGFLGTPMVMQFTWQGCDSLLAAPLVIDLVRLTDLASRLGEKGLLTFLASFFKSPLGTTEHDFVRQFQMLEDWVETQKAKAS
ncbi:Myo-inositol-1-phosphate synthase [Pirellula staleyi DSM 6068]|uniref:Myo-inositol-1-phosphate synthase n=1 Tax=Pirellula staleyi (strain ATCC 27377 / DSM 6068 / ICPB 4128) TaxID=530564 RepID=D2R9D3_PIRSD|nr:inositol-3-phosphate synthase [Pirellula staleyi]ADB17683.1 Myo-inositol-1-phosphate synthase [Pirellula staleyi DSM 6068]